MGGKSQKDGTVIMGEVDPSRYHVKNQNGKVEKMVVVIKTFDHYHHKFQLFQLSCKIVKELETEI